MVVSGGSTPNSTTAAGVLFLARDTGRCLLQLRNSDKRFKHTWGFWGGMMEKGETPFDYFDELIKDKHSREIYKKSLEILSVLGDYWPAHIVRIKNYYELITSHIAEMPKSFSEDKNWADNLIEQLGKEMSSESDAERIEQICEKLAESESIQQPEWSKVVRHAISISTTYAQITEISYGEAMPLSFLDEDEGSALDIYGDEHLYNFDYLLNLFAEKKTQASPDWATLVIELANFKAEAIGYMSCGDEEAENFVRKSHVKNHSQFGKIVTALKLAFPFAEL